MANTEQKLKEFFSDKEKVKEFLKDEEFIGKVSGGTATSQDYINKFNEFDINLTKKEAEDISQVTDKMLSTGVEKLNDQALESLSGGQDNGFRTAIGLTGGIGAIGAGVASLVCYHKSKKAYSDGDTEKALKYQTTAAVLSGAAGASAAFGLASL